MAEEEVKTENPAGGTEPEIKNQSPNSGSRLSRLKAWYAGNKKLSIPATVLVLILILVAVPFTRYALAGTVMKNDLAVKVLDDTSLTPVSGATVSLGGLSADTNGSGVATLK